MREHFGIVTRWPTPVADRQDLANREAVIFSQASDHSPFCYTRSKQVNTMPGCNHSEPQILQRRQYRLEQASELPPENW